MHETRNQNFSRVDNAFIRVVNDEKNEDIARHVKLLI